jgi:MFS-type transporter involved in bile tolerance (Atg22 family)
VATQISGSQSFGVGTLVLVFIAGFLLFQKADKACKALGK